MTVVRAWEKAGLDGPSVTTSGIGAAASASAAASVVFASFPAELQIQVQSVCSERVAVQKGIRTKSQRWMQAWTLKKLNLNPSDPVTHFVSN